MKSIKNLANTSASLPLAADDILEYHAARLTLLFELCGVKGRIEGLTKMAKLDFFVRYPKLFDEACAKLKLPVEAPTARNVDTAMIRHHYGPWDPRYYQILAFLEARGVITVSKDGSTYVFNLTPEGVSLAKKLAKQTSFADLCVRMKNVKAALGKKSGTVLKTLIYELFDEEVANRELGEVIHA